MAKDRKSIVLEKRWMTIEEAQRYLGFGNRDTQQEWRDTGQLPYHVVGRTIIYDKSDVDAFVARHKVQSLTNKPYNYERQAQ